MINPKLFRPKMWIACALPLLIGNFLHGGYEPKIVYGIIVVCLTSSGAIAFNQYCDFDQDKHNPQKKNLPLIRGTMPKNAALSWAVFLLLLAIVFSFLLGPKVFFLTCVACILSIQYSIPKGLKTLPILDSLTNGICYGLLPILMGWFLANNTFFCQPFLVGMLFTLGLSSGHMLLAIPDVISDKRNKRLTTALFLGETGTVKLSFLLVLLMTAFLLLLLLCRIIPNNTLVAVPVLGIILYKHWRLKKKRDFEGLSSMYLIAALLFLFGLIVQIVLGGRWHV